MENRYTGGIPQVCPESKVPGYRYTNTIIEYDETANSATARLLPIIEVFFEEVESVNKFFLTEIPLSYRSNSDVEWDKEILVLPYRVVETNNQRIDLRNKSLDVMIRCCLSINYKGIEFTFSQKDGYRTIMLRKMKIVKPDNGCTLL